MGAVVDSKTGSLLIQIAFSLHNKIIAVGNRRYKQRPAAATPRGILEKTPSCTILIKKANN